MKKITLNQLFKNICNTCITLAGILAMNHASFIFFGEPEYPENEEKKNNLH